MRDVLIIGAGPAGLFAASELAEAGLTVAILDRGEAMERRKCPETKTCDCPVCSMLCGIGGAGGFSDGKNTISIGRGTQGERIFKEEDLAIMEFVDEEVARMAGTIGVQQREVDDTGEFSRFGFRFGSYPLRHVGSDGIRKSICVMHDELEAKGVDIFTNTMVDDVGRFGSDFVIRTHDSVYGHGPTLFYAKKVIIASGLDGAPWLSVLADKLGIGMSSGPAGFGLRLETSSEVLEPLFSTFYDWKMERGRLRSFCCNHEGMIVNENHKSLGVKNVNGHSFLNPARRTDSSNCAIIAKIQPAMTVTGDPQTEVVEMARAINADARGHTAFQTVVDFLSGRPTFYKDAGHGVRTNYQSEGGVDIGKHLDRIPGLLDDYREYLKALDEIVPGVIDESSLIYGPEVKYYARKLVLDEWECSEIPGLFIVGNATGYLDSFVAAATSGVLAAKKIITEVN